MKKNNKKQNNINTSQTIDSVDNVNKKVKTKNNSKSKLSKNNSSNEKLEVKQDKKEIKKTLIKRRKKGENKQKMYFDDNTQAAIVEYQKTISLKEKDKIYFNRIMPAFEKLVENLINIHRFSGLHDTYDDLKHDCVSFLFETICKFDESRGTKAFSYFNVVAKNWLIIKTKTKSIKSKRTTSLDDSDSLTTNENKMIDEYCSIASHDGTLERKYAAHSILNLMYEIRSLAKTENELSCINSIITIFENIEDLDLLNKSAILVYIKEISGLSPKQLTTAMQSIKKYYSKLKFEPEFNFF